MKKADVRIICLGNPLHGNDRLGHVVFNALLGETLPEGTELIDGGTGGMTLLPYFRDCQKVLIIDLVKSEHKDGSVHLYQDFPRLLSDQISNRGEHGGDLATLVKMLPVYLSQPPQVDLMCVTANHAAAFESRMEKSVRGAMTDLLAQISDYINHQNRQAVCLE